MRKSTVHFPKAAMLSSSDKFNYTLLTNQALAFTFASKKQNNFILSIQHSTVLQSEFFSILWKSAAENER